MLLDYDSASDISEHMVHILYVHILRIFGLDNLIPVLFGRIKRNPVGIIRPGQYHNCQQTEQQNQHNNTPEDYIRIRKSFSETFYKIRSPVSGTGERNVIYNGVDSLPTVIIS